MKRLVGVGVLSVVGLVALVGSAAASAATEFGDNCAANKVTAAAVPFTLFATTAIGDPLSLTAPSAGVITKWMLNQSPVEALTIPQTLRVLHPTGPNTVQVVGEATQTVTTGSNSFETRIPVQAGDRLGLSGVGEKAILFCEQGGPKSLLNIFENTGGVGSTVTIETKNQSETEARLPVSAVIEPDADGDGFGDETQDKCPTNASTQGPCPPALAPATPITLSATSAARKGLVSLTVTATAQASVSVGGSVKLGKGKTAKLSGGTQIVAPGALAKFTVLFPAKLKARLKQLTTKQSLSLKLAVSAPGATTKNLTVRAKGSKAAKPRRHKG
jgi:hypothetical protein